MGERSLCYSWSVRVACTTNILAVVTRNCHKKYKASYENVRDDSFSILKLIMDGQCGSSAPSETTPTSDES